jgi:hypothetical protein
MQSADDRMLQLLPAKMLLMLSVQGPQIMDGKIKRVAPLPSLRS